MKSALIFMACQGMRAALQGIIQDWLRNSLKEDTRAAMVLVFERRKTKCKWPVKEYVLLPKSPGLMLQRGIMADKIGLDTE